MKFENFQPQIARMNADVPVPAGTHLRPSATSAAEEGNALREEFCSFSVVAKFATVRREGNHTTVPAISSRLSKGIAK